MSEPSSRMPLRKKTTPSLTLPHDSSRPACSFTIVQPDPENTLASLHNKQEWSRAAVALKVLPKGKSKSDQEEGQARRVQQDECSPVEGRDFAILCPSHNRKEEGHTQRQPDAFSAVQPSKCLSIHDFWCNNCRDSGHR